MTDSALETDYFTDHAVLLDPYEYFEELRQHGPGELPGMSAFVLQDGVVFHTYSAYARGLDAMWGMYQWLDRAPLGRNEGEGGWFRRHDSYEVASA